MTTPTATPPTSKTTQTTHQHSKTPLHGQSSPLGQLSPSGRRSSTKRNLQDPSLLQDSNGPSHGCKSNASPPRKDGRLSNSPKPNASPNVGNDKNVINDESDFTPEKQIKMHELPWYYDHVKNGIARMLAEFAPEHTLEDLENVPPQSNASPAQPTTHSGTPNPLFNKPISPYTPVWPHSTYYPNFVAQLTEALEYLAQHPGLALIPHDELRKTRAGQLMWARIYEAMSDSEGSDNDDDEATRDGNGPSHGCKRSPNSATRSTTPTTRRNKRSRDDDNDEGGRAVKRMREQYDSERQGQHQQGNSSIGKPASGKRTREPEEDENGSDSSRRKTMSAVTSPSRKRLRESEGDESGGSKRRKVVGPSVTSSLIPVYMRPASSSEKRPREPEEDDSSERKRRRVTRSTIPPSPIPIDVRPAQHSDGNVCTLSSRNGPRESAKDECGESKRRNIATPTIPSPTPRPTCQPDIQRHDNALAYLSLSTSPSAQTLAILVPTQRQTRSAKPAVLIELNNRSKSSLQRPRGSHDIPDTREEKLRKIDKKARQSHSNKARRSRKVISRAGV